MESAYQNTVDEVRNLKGIEEALALAIEREKEAKDFYMQQAAMMENPKFKELYEHLAGEEVKHLGYLEEYRDKKELPAISTEVPSGQSFSLSSTLQGQKWERLPSEMQAYCWQP